MRVVVCLIFFSLDAGLKKQITFFPQNFPLKTSIPFHAEPNPLQFHGKKCIYLQLFQEKKNQSVSNGAVQNQLFEC